jgi:choline-sulfatase
MDQRWGTLRGVTRITLLLALALTACTRESPLPSSQSPSTRPSILLITLDTTRADAIGPATPALDALARRGLVFRQAYATVPQTLPSHTSMLTGLYPGGHGVHENARRLDESRPLIAEQLRSAGYRTAAFVSAFVLARRFGLTRGFALYDDEFPAGLQERNARATTDRALAFLAANGVEARTTPPRPLFLWVHYYDPHYPYTPPEPFRSRYATQPYLGEVAFVDEQLGRLVKAFGDTFRDGAIIAVADHGEGLGEHGEAQHGNLLYQATMHVPLVIAGPGVSAGTSDTPVSTRRVYDTIADWAGLKAAKSLRRASREVLAGEAMKPFLDYGWQPQVMAVDGARKAILAGQLEVYDVVADPGETHNLAQTAELSRDARATLREYPIPSIESAAAAIPSDDEERRKLASLGYVASTVKPVVRKDAPRPADMAPLFPILDRASGLFVREQYRDAIPLLEQILAKDPHNLDAALRLATAHSALGHEREAIAAFENAQRIAPQSPDVRMYLALHYARGKEWEKAAPMLEQIVAQFPDRVAALEALVVIRERQRRLDEALALRQKLYSLRAPTPAELVQLGALAMITGQTPVAIDAFEKARAAQGSAFHNDLELGVLYLDARRFEEARDELDRVPPSHPAFPMALFKRAQVSVLLHEPDAPARIAAARAHANAMTRQLIERERLFQ